MKKNLPVQITIHPKTDSIYLTECITNTFLSLMLKSAYTSCKAKNINL